MNNQVNQRQRRSGTAVYVVIAAILVIAILSQIFAAQPGFSASSSRLTANRVTLTSGELLAIPGVRRFDLKSTDLVRPIVGANEILNGVLETDDGRVLEIYIARWEPGNVFAEEVTRHTPDMCWPTNGWTEMEAISRAQLPIPGGTLQAGEWRAFQAATGERQEVLYWQIEDGESKEILDTRGIGANWFTRFVGESEFIDRLGKLLRRNPRKADVYFIRVNAARDLKDVFDSEVSARVLRFLANGVLVKPSAREAIHK